MEELNDDAVASMASRQTKCIFVWIGNNLESKNVILSKLNEF